MSRKRAAEHRKKLQHYYWTRADSPDRVDWEWLEKLGMHLSALRDKRRRAHEQD